MSNWNRSDVIALSSLMVSVVAMIIGIAIPEVRCFVGLQSESCPSSIRTAPKTPSEPNTWTIPPSTKTTITSTPFPPDSTVSPQYTKLENLLAAKKWKEADLETFNIMLKVAGRESEGWLDSDSLENFSCSDLQTINSLWLSSSNGKFGFSVQKDIWIEVGGTPGGQEEFSTLNYTISKKFAYRNGWGILNSGFLRYSDLTFNINAPPGNLPARYMGRLEWVHKWRLSSAVKMYGLFSRAANCNL